MHRFSNMCFFAILEWNRENWNNFMKQLENEENDQAPEEEQEQ